MATTHTKILGITISLTWLSFLASLLFIKTLMIKYEDFIALHVNAFLIVSGLIVLFFIAIGAISISSLTGKVKENI